MKNAKKLLEELGVVNYTQRHLDIINEFIESGSDDIKGLLSSLGSWDAADLSTAEDWFNLS